MKPSRPTNAVEHAPAGELMSSFVDGECPPGAIDEACRRWAADASLRRTWQTYHLIGDVLRSDELSPARPTDDTLLTALRERLKAEPVPLAPAPLPAPAVEPRRRWRAPVAIAAGVMVAGTVLVVLRPGASGTATGWDAPIAAAPPAVIGVRSVGAGQPPTPAASQPQWVLDGQVIRDARLDAYFEAHRGAVGPVPSALPGGALRSVDLLVPQR